MVESNFENCSIKTTTGPVKGLGYKSWTLDVMLLFLFFLFYIYAIRETCLTRIQRM